MRLSDWSVSAVVAGFLAVLVSCSRRLVIFYQAAQAAHMPNEMFASWVWGISTGAAVSGIFLSWKLKAPVITAWSAPAGLALLGAITANVAGMIAAEDHREASMMTFLATASGMTVFGLGSAFWGIVIGMLAYLALHHRQPSPAPSGLRQPQRGKEKIIAAQRSSPRNRADGRACAVMDHPYWTVQFSTTRRLR